MQVEFDINDLSLGDAEDLEEYTGLSVMELDGALRAGKVSTRVVTGIIWIMKRREDPSFTLAQARAIKFAELEVEVPKAPAADGAAAPASPGSGRSATTTQA